MHRPSALILLIAAALVGGEAGPPPQGGQDGKPNHRPGPPPEELFQKADADKDGKVTLAELTAAIESRGKVERTAMFDRMDANHDGNVSKEEFLAFEPPAPPGEDGQPKKRRGPDPAEMMKHMDRNGDGVITADELPKRDGRPGKDGKEGKEGKGGKDDKNDD